MFWWNMFITKHLHNKQYIFLAKQSCNEFILSDHFHTKNDVTTREN